MPIANGQSYSVNSFDLGFINMTPVEIVLQITGFNRATNELELALVPDVCNLAATYEAIGRWFKETYPSRSKDNCMLKNACAFEKLVDLKFASPLPYILGHGLSPLQSSIR
jgi:hypothetical protein